MCFDTYSKWCCFKINKIWALKGTFKCMEEFPISLDRGTLLCMFSWVVRCSLNQMYELPKELGLEEQKQTAVQTLHGFLPSDQFQNRSQRATVHTSEQMQKKSWNCLLYFHAISHPWPADHKAWGMQKALVCTQRLWFVRPRKHLSFPASSFQLFCGWIRKIQPTC